MKLATWLLASMTLLLAAAPARAQEDKEAHRMKIREIERSMLEEKVACPCLVLSCPGVYRYPWLRHSAGLPSAPPVPPQDEKEALKKKILEEIEKKLKEETDRILKEIEKIIDDEIAKAKGKKPDAPPAAPGPAKPGFLGVRPTQDQPSEEEFKEMKIEGGVRIEVIEGAPAEKAGLQDEDIILEIDGTQVKSFPEMPRLLQKKAAGAEVKLKVQRGKQTKEFTVKLAERPEEPGAPGPAPEPPKEPPKPEGKPGSLGVKPGEASGKGMVINGVVDGSPASKAGIKEGDVLTKIDATPIWKEDDLASFMKGAKAGQEVDVTILRDGKETKFKIKLAERK